MAQRDSSGSSSSGGNDSDGAGRPDRRPFNRRSLLLAGTSLGLGSALPGCESGATPGSVTPGGVTAKSEPTKQAGARPAGSAPNDPVLGLVKLGAPPWPTFDP